MDYETVSEPSPRSHRRRRRIAKPKRMLQGIIDHVKARLDGTEADVGPPLLLGPRLTAMDEPEQALLKFEKVLGIDPEHEPALWETASIFLHDLERPGKRPSSARR